MASTIPNALVKNTRTKVEGLAQNLGTGREILNKYNINNAMYPSDLLSDNNPYGDNYVVFYVNVPESSKLISDGRVTVTDRDTTELGSGAKQTVASTAKKVFGDSGVKAINNTDKEYLNISARQTKRITDTITMNIPNNLSSRYSMNYQEENMALATAAATIGGDVIQFIKDATSNNGQSVIEDGKPLAKSIVSGTALAALNLPGAGNIAQAATGLAPNPKKEQLFKGVDFRVFSFDYTFAPRNAQEANNVDKIIKMFKLHMHPEFKDDNGFIFLYPSEFEIVYYQGNSENLNLPRHTSAVLVDLSVNYTPQGMFNTFNDGKSTIINMNLTFKELAILTKAEILDGF